MGGSSGGSTFSGMSPTDLRRQIRDAEMEAAEKGFSPKLAQRLNDLLARVNDRDYALTSERLDAVKGVLKEELESSVDLRFGGSVAKHTYVDGLSDVDMLMVIRADNNDMSAPTSLLNTLAQRLSEQLPRDVEVSRGRIAITLRYPDGDELQLIPAVRYGEKLHVPAWRRDEWSRIDPEKFRQGLAKRNEQCGMKLVPTIKLAKAINATLPEPLRLSGYHVESMAISAFRHYSGPFVIEKMLPHFMACMAELVKTPIRDSTGQSVHVDEYLGRSNSGRRQQISHVLDRMARRMQNATAAGSLEQWNTILGE